MQTNVTVSKGFTTWLGIAVAVMSAVAAAVAPMLDGDQTPEVLALIITAALAAVRTIDGRMKQAAATIAASPTQALEAKDEVYPETDVSGEPDEDDPEDVPPAPVPDDSQLREMFPEEAPPVEPEGALGGKAGEQS